MGLEISSRSCSQTGSTGELFSKFEVHVRGDIGLFSAISKPVSDAPTISGISGASCTVILSKDFNFGDDI